MASRRKVSHHNQIVEKISTSLSSIDIGDIIEFNYKGKNIYDSSPMVFILRKQPKIIQGINLNYLTEYKVQQLLQEKTIKKLQWYELYDQAIRSYSKVKMKSIKKVQYGKDPDAT